LLQATFAGSMSSPVAWCPADAMADAMAVAVGSPAKPRPMTQTRLDGAGLNAGRSISESNKITSTSRPGGAGACTHLAAERVTAT
jgi:hypothetical protein